MTVSHLPLPDEDLTERLTPLLADVEDRLASAVVGADALVDSFTRHLVDAGGKRIRPALTLLAAELGSRGEASRDAVLTAAVAVELTHIATLYHDDVMDSAPLRRGAPAAQALWGNSVAILSGDVLFARASRLVADLGPEAVRIHAETFERLCLGQLRETVGPAEHDDPVAHYIDVLADKTGSLIATAAQYGALFSGASADVAEVVRRYGEKVGVAFQLADDVIDLISDSETTGKTPGTDLREGVATMPVLLLRAHAARGQLDEQGTSILTRIDGGLESDADLADVVAALRAHPVLTEARELAEAWVSDAVAELEALPESAVKESLSSFAALMVDRLA